MTAADRFTDTGMDIRVIPHLALESARRDPDAPAIVPSGGPVITHGMLADAMMATARAFLAAGLRTGDRVAIWAPNGERWVIAALGAQAAGGVLVPLNTRYKAGEAAHILRASGARMLFTVGDFLGNRYPDMIAAEAVPLLERVVVMDGGDWDAFVRAGDGATVDATAARLASLSGDDACDMLFTSGTTGRPKGVVTTHGQNIALYRDYSTALGWSAADRQLGINPFFHAFGYKVGWLCSIMWGSALYPVEVFDAATVLDLIERERITLMAGPPTIFQALLALPLAGRDLASLRLAITGAATVPTALIHAMKDRLGYDDVLTAYGLTETCGTVTMCARDDDAETVSTTAGRPLPGVEVMVVDRDGVAVPTGTPGDILVRGYNVMREYFDDPVATAEAIDAAGWLRTGDVGVLSDDGCLRITDRSKDVYMCGGFNVYPAEVETILAGHPGIAEVAAVAMPDERLGEVGHVFVVAKPGAGLSGLAGERALIAWAREQMANYKAPRAVTFVESLPRNALGKVEKFKLRGIGNPVRGELPNGD